MEDSTIAALSSGATPAGVAVIRVSGPRARAALRALAGRVPEPRRASLRTIRNRHGEALDRGLVLLFDAPRTATGEDVAEFHLHGGRATVAAVLEALLALGGIRLAEAGEFTRRAFANGLIDLTEAEGLADLLAAETEAQRRQAFAQAGGVLRALYESWMERLTRIRALLEASFDFADEGDVAEDVAAPVRPLVAALAAEIRRHLAQGSRGEILRRGFRVALAGAPNAGKSTLLNALADRDVAIVTALPGTTRDVLEVALDLGGVPVRLFDTAGLREAAEEAERIGVERARAAIATADLVLFVDAPDAPLPDAADFHVKHIDGGQVLRVETKADLRPDGSGAHEAIRVSAHTGAGLEELSGRIAAIARDSIGDPTQAIPVRLRHRDALEAVLFRMGPAGEPDVPAEIAAEHLRLAADELGRLTGRTGVEDLLGVIFAEFCVGK